MASVNGAKVDCMSIVDKTPRVEDGRIGLVVVVFTALFVVNLSSVVINVVTADVVEVVVNDGMDEVDIVDVIDSLLIVVTRDVFNSAVVAIVVLVLVVVVVGLVVLIFHPK